MKFILHRHKHFWSNRLNTTLALSGAVLFFLSVVLSYFATIYAAGVAGEPSTDLILSNTPALNVDWAVNDLTLIFIGFIIALLILEPRHLPFLSKSVALFIVIRSVFITFTHLGPFPTRSYLDPNDWLYFANIGGDFFFSGHTGLPFLLALIFWQDKKLRYVCLAVSVLLGTCMLLGHLHYTIDVLAAFFITYAIYKLSEQWFKKDKEIFDGTQG